MRDYQSLAHTTWDCKYHIVFIPKGRKKAIFGAIRRHLGQVLHELSPQKECKIAEGHLMSDHVQMCISILPKHSVRMWLHPQTVWALPAVFNQKLNCADTIKASTLLPSNSPSFLPILS